MKHFLLANLLLFTSNFLIGQVDAKNGVFFKKFFTSEVSSTTEESSIKGSPYSDKVFIKGEVAMKDGNTYKSIPLRYNIFLDRIEFSNEGAIFYISDPNQIKNVKIGNFTYVYTIYYDGSKIKKSHFLLHHKVENNKLLKKERIEFENAENPIAFQNAKPARYKKMPNIFYLKFGAKPAVEVKRRKHIAKLFPSYQTEIEKYVKKNKVSPKSVKDLVNLLDYYSKISK